MISDRRTGDDDDVSRETAATAKTVFGESLPTAQRYAELLATAGVRRGLLGPREVPRLWTRHLLNCAAVSAGIPANCTVIDVGSGAGLPGLVLALLRADLRVMLVEPMRRRSDFLDEAVERLGLGNVTIRRARAEQIHGERADIVTARAVAPLAKLAGWCLPLVEPGGALLAMKGASADQELVAAEPVLRQLGARRWSVEVLGAGDLIEPTTVVRVTVGRGVGRSSASGSLPAGRSAPPERRAGRTDGLRRIRDVLAFRDGSPRGVALQGGRLSRAVALTASDDTPLWT